MGRLGIVLLLPFAVSAGAAELDSRELLSQVRQAYTSSPSFTATFVQTYAPAGFAAASPEPGHVILQAPDQIRFDYDGTEGKVFTFDGRSARQYVAADKQLVVKTLTAEDRARLPLLFFESPDDVLARFRATVTSGANGLAEVTLVPRSGSDPKSVTLSVGSGGDVKRLVVVDGADNRTVFTFTQKVPGGKRPAADFTLTPPEGTKIITD